MLKIIEILNTDNFIVTCKFNNGKVKKINMLPLLKNHQNLKGIEQLHNQEIFKKVEIGKLGEIVWKQIITTTYNNETFVWDYDVCPDFAYQLN